MWWTALASLRFLKDHMTHAGQWKDRCECESEREINSYTYLVMSSIASIWLNIEILIYSEVITLILLASVATSGNHVTTKLFTHR